MAATKYTYSVSGDFSNGVAPSKFSLEIEDDATIVKNLLRVHVSGADCDVWFDDVLSGAEETALVALVAAHDGSAEISSWKEEVLEVQTTSDAWQEVPVTIRDVFPAGTYKVSWSAECYAENGIKTRVRLDDSTLIASNADDLNNLTKRRPFSGFKFVTLPSDGVRRFDLDYCSFSAGSASKLIRITLLVERAN
jgi:hypothetical protein